ncbi:FAM49 family protein [Pelomyxa schiedti]|nr:FAM49 family protein [Pelomyxa schiedti]
MGQLLAHLMHHDDAAQIFIDFENATPAPAEQALWQQIHDVLQTGPTILQKLIEYVGCEQWIYAAIQNPNPETEDTAWNKVLPAVDQLQEFYEFSLLLEQSFPKLLVALCKDDPKASLSNQQALAKQLGDVFDFVLRFDDAKMVNPAIQNDFSYYRRTLSRMKLSKKDLNIKVRDELANRMSLFFAYPTPMMKVLSETTAKFLDANATVPRENVTQALGHMANICLDMVDKRRFTSNDTNMFCLRVMTGAIILYDHVSESGVFTRRSPVNIKGAVQVLKAYSTSTTTSTDGLVNALRFTTVHLADAETPGSIKQLLA